MSFTGNNKTFIQLVRSIDAINKELSNQAKKSVNISLTIRNCTIRDVWRGLDRSIPGFLESITLEEIVKAGDDGASGYCI